MAEFWNKWYQIFITFMLISTVVNESENVSNKDFIEVTLSDIELQYLNDRLSTKEYMCDYDVKNTIIELQHFYTVIKNNDGMFQPSAMVDKAWHHHILNTRMYRTFSRQNFGLEILHHVPFWNSNEEEVAEYSNEIEQFTPMDTYNTIVSIFGEENVNKTVWYLSESELDEEPFEILEHDDL